MKTIVAACIEQILEFSSEQEYNDYLYELNRKKQRFIVVRHKQDDSGKVILHIRKQYNKNLLPADWDEFILKYKLS